MNLSDNLISLKSQNEPVFINNKKYPVKFSNISDIIHIGHNYRQSEYNKFLYSSNKKEVKIILAIKNGTYGSISPLMIEFGVYLY